MSDFVPRRVDLDPLKEGTRSGPDPGPVAFGDPEENLDSERPAGLAVMLVPLSRHL